MFSNIPGHQSINVRSPPTQDMITQNMPNVIKCLPSVRVCVGGRVMYLHVHWEPLRFEIKTLNKSPQRRYETWYPTQKGKENLWLLWKVVGSLGGGIWLQEVSCWGEGNNFLHKLNFFFFFSFAEKHIQSFYYSAIYCYT